MFLRSIKLDASALPDSYPFTVPIVESLETLNFSKPVTFFVGENGCGKSTLLEAIACGLHCTAVGAVDVTREPMLEPARRLAEKLKFTKSINPRTRLFFRAEDAIGFIRTVKASLDDLTDLESEYDRTLSGYGRKLAMGAVRNQRNELSKRYGEDPDARSHGEWFLNIMQERINRPGLYLLDEPETPLSPIHQLTLLSLLKALVNSGAQFIIATHSPILMAFPDADILTMDKVAIEKIAWEDVEHVAITRAFLADPEAYLRHL